MLIQFANGKGLLQCGRPREGAEGERMVSDELACRPSFNAVGPVKGPKAQGRCSFRRTALACFNAVGPVKGPKAEGKLYVVAAP